MFLVFVGWATRQQLEVIEYLRTENQLKERLGKKRTPQRRSTARVGVKGKVLGRKLLEEFGTLFTPDHLKESFPRLRPGWILTSNGTVLGEGHGGPAGPYRRAQKSVDHYSLITLPDVEPRRALASFVENMALDSIPGALPATPTLPQATVEKRPSAKATRRLSRKGEARQLAVSQRLGIDLLNEISVTNDRDGPARVGVVFFGVIDAERVEIGCGDIVGGDGLVPGKRGIVIAFADDLSSPHATAGHQHEHTARIVVAASLGRSRVDFGSPAEFAADQEGSRIEQALLIQSRQQRGDACVEFGKVGVFQFREVILMCVPTAERDRDELHARLDQSSCEQAALTERFLVKRLGEGRRFLTDVEGLPGSLGSDNRSRLLAESVQSGEQLAVLLVARKRPV